MQPPYVVNLTVTASKIKVPITNVFLFVTEP